MLQRLEKANYRIGALLRRGICDLGAVCLESREHMLRPCSGCRCNLVFRIMESPGDYR